MMSTGTEPEVRTQGGRVFNNITYTLYNDKESIKSVNIYGICDDPDDPNITSCDPGYQFSIIIDYIRNPIW